jgi:hypothetical protein
VLIFGVFINDKLIDEVHVQRTETTKKGLNSYTIRIPFGFEHVKIKHQYEDGYIPLAAKVFTKLQEEGYKRER